MSETPTIEEPTQQAPAPPPPTSPPSNNDLIEAAKKEREKYEKKVHEKYQVLEDQLRGFIEELGREPNDYERRAKISLDESKAWFLKP